MEMPKRRILFVTAIRSEYDIQSSVIAAVDAHPELEAAIVVAGAHLSPMYGETVREVERDGIRIAARIESLLNADSRSARVKSAAIEIMGLVDVCLREKPAFLLAPMDREEAVVVALVGAYLSIPTVHLGGGETADDGNVDNSVRHAVSKLAHLHAVTTESSAARLVAMGEEPWRIRVVGAPGLDRLLASPEMKDDELWSRLECAPPNGPFVIVVQHAILSGAEASHEEMTKTLEAVEALDLPAFIGYPNSDAGSQRIIAAIEEHVARRPGKMHVYRNLARAEFVNLFRRAHALVGNSSAGLLEAPLFHIPAVNVGDRQKGREQAGNVEFVAHEVDAIRESLRRAVFDAEYRARLAHLKSPYGDGTAGKRIAEWLAGIEIDARLLGKKNAY
jgi:GDP/UDP-N,N'-diacetylbacillosamine 2-epimerase (hydrolysing)